jgi:hypothetical protein
MLNHDERRDFIRMDVDCDITYKLPDNGEVKTGRCMTLSGAGLSFQADDVFDVGIALEVCIIPKSTITPPMTAYIEVVRTNKLTDGYEIAGTIKSIKGN